MRKSVRLLIVLVVLAVIAFVIEKNRSKSLSPREYYLLKEVELGEVDEISIIQGEDTVNLRKSGGEWMILVNGDLKRCDKSKVERVFTTLDSLKGEVVSSNPSKYDEFEVGKDSRMVVLISGSDTMCTLYIGKTGPSFSSTYVRLAGKKPVFLVNRYLKGIFPTETGRWRDRKIVDLDKEKVTGIQIIKGKRILELQREDTVFVTKKGTCDTTKINSFLFTWCKLRAVGFADTVSLKGAGLVKPQYTVVLACEDGTEVKLLVGKEKEKGRYYLKRADDDQIYLVASYTVNRIKELMKEEKKKK